MSLILPVHFVTLNFSEYYSDNSNSEYLGVIYLILGYITALESPIDFICWLGNFSLLFGWIFWKRKTGLVLSVLTLIQMSLYGINHIFQLNILEINSYEYPLFGYWIWILSAVIILIGTIIQNKNKKSNI